MDDTNAPSCNLSLNRPVVVASSSSQKTVQLKSSKKEQNKDAGRGINIMMHCNCIIVCLVSYVSSQKLRRIASTILLFPSLCFTITQLHRNSLLHNVSGIDVRCVLEQWIAVTSNNRREDLMMIE